MRFAEDDNPGRYQIRSYSAGEIAVNDERLTRSLVVSAARLIRDWPPQRFEDITREDLGIAAGLDPEILILGTGARVRFPHPSLVAGLQAQGIGVEVMDTAAACRTYNVLASEQRHVVAALLMIEPA